MSALRRLIIFSLVWLVLCAGNLASLVVGVPVIVLAVWLSQHLERTEGGARLSVRRLPEFVVLFIWESIRGGVDVAARAFQCPPRLPCGWLGFRTSLPSGPPRVFFVTLISLFPGSLSVELEDDILVVHVLDRRLASEGELRRAERAVARLFRVELNESE